MFRKRSYGYGGPVPRQSMQAGALVGGLLGAGKNLVGQLFDDQKGVNIGQVAKAGLAGAAGTIPGVGGMAANMIQGAGQPTPPQPQQPNPAAAYMQQPAAPGAAAFNPYMNNPYQQKNGGMNGVRLMKRGGYNSGVISAQGGNQTPTIYQAALQGLSPEERDAFMRINNQLRMNLPKSSAWDASGKKITEGGRVYVDLDEPGGYRKEGGERAYDPARQYGFAAAENYPSLRMAGANEGLFSEGFDPQLTYDSYLQAKDDYGRYTNPSMNPDYVPDPTDATGWREVSRGDVLQDMFDLATREGVYRSLGGESGKGYNIASYEMPEATKAAWQGIQDVIRAGGNPYSMTQKDYDAVRAGKQAIGGRAPQGVISAQGGVKNPDSNGIIPASDFRLHLRDGEREFYRVNPEGGFSYVGPQSEVMKLIDPDQKVGFFRDVLGYEQVGDNKYFPIGNDIQKARALQEQQDIAFGEELRRDPAYRSAITREATEFAKKGAPLDMTPSEQAFSFVLQGLRDQASERAGKQFAGGRAPIQAKRGVRVINGYG